MDTPEGQDNFVKVSIIVPAYNEEATIEESIRGVIDLDLGDLDKEIVVVDDRSTDRTPAIVRSLGEGIVLIEQTVNRGKGAAIRRALDEITGDIAVIHDADLEYNPADIPALIAPIVAGDAPASFGTRFAGGARPAGMKFANYAANRILAITASLLFATSLSDEATCYKAVRSDLLRSFDLKCQRFEFCPEVTAKLLRDRHKIAEVPVQYHARSVEEGKKIHWYDGLEAIWTLTKYRFTK
ncbi:MAG: glycosyltransferase family 2 protein [Capsulimonadaceae bacterium]|nr:glycosyltransferase family 2 protein [Capsulimonadaceae bacterium]